MLTTIVFNCICSFLRCRVILYIVRNMFLKRTIINFYRKCFMIIITIITVFTFNIFIETYIFFFLFKIR